jgi:threonine synthase
MFRCVRCGRTYGNFKGPCKKCGSVLVFDYEGREWHPEGQGVWRYQSMISVKRSISLSEGNTPLVKRRDTDEQVYLKLEGDNPTGSFKDRGSTIVISDAFNKGFKEAVVASTGNMGASVAAYCAYANIGARVFIPKDVTEEKISQIRVYGADLVRVAGGFSNAVDKAKMEAAQRGIYLAMTGLNPYFIEGLKTIAFELFEQMGIPDKIIVPTGSGGLITAIFKGFVELNGLGIIKKLPQMIAVQSSAVGPIVEAWKTGKEIVPPKEAKTIASAIMVKVPFNGYSAIEAINLSKGTGVTVTDDQIVSAIKTLGKEGVFAEPAAAAAYAALEEISVKKEDRIALIITGSGLKDPDVVLKNLSPIS